MKKKMGKLPLLPTNFFQNQKKKFLEQLSLYMPCRVSKSMPIHKYHVVLSQEGSPSYRNELIDLFCKTIDWFLHDGQHWSLMG